MTTLTPTPFLCAIGLLALAGLAIALWPTKPDPTTPKRDDFGNYLDTVRRNAGRVKGRKA